MFLHSFGVNQQGQKQQPKYVTTKFHKLPQNIRNDFDIEDRHIIPEEDQDFVYRVLVQSLKYPDDKLAELHKLANRLGKNDLRTVRNASSAGTQQSTYEVKTLQDQSKQNIFTQDQLIEDIPLQEESSRKDQQFCSCCGFIKQKEQISICQDFQQFPIIGLSTFLYFRSIFNVGVLLMLLFVIYSLFAMVSNFYIAAQTMGYGFIDSFSLIGTYFMTIFSYKSIQLNYLLQLSDAAVLTKVSSILIICIVTIWSICVYIFKHYQVEHQQMIDDGSITASDFSVMIEDAPIDLFKDKNNIIKQFNDYFQHILPFIQKQYFQTYLKKEQNSKSKISIQQELKNLKVKKINIGIPFYLNSSNLETDKQYQDLLKKLEQHKEKLIEWINQFFQHKKLTVKVQRRQNRLTQFKDTLQSLRIKKQAFFHNLEAGYKKKTPDQLTTTVFVTFQSSIAAKIVYELNPSDFMSNVHYFITCCNNQRYLKIKNKKGQVAPLKIARAPQPEDIVWANIGFSFCKIFSRRLLTYLITISILVGSFWFITFLSDIQIKTQNSLISIAISLTISLLNVGIGQIIYKLTAFQKDVTQTNYQASLALKSIVAQLINSIAIPVLVKKDNIYGPKGLVEDVFFLAFTSAFIGPLIRYFDFYYLYTRIMFWYKAKPNKRIGLTQAQLNGYSELLLFQAGFEYIYVANLFLISCFYTPLQPIIPLISVIGLLLMYWVQKYSLLNRMKRPIPGSDIINETVCRIINLGPIALATGALVFSNLLSSNQDTELKFLLHLISIALGCFFYFLPFKTIYRIIYSDDQKFDNLSYFQNRILLASQYDRTNPATIQEGLDDFMNYLKELNNAITSSTFNTQSSNKIADNLAILYRRANENPHSKLNQSIKKVNAQNNNLLTSLFNKAAVKQHIPGMGNLPKNTKQIHAFQDKRPNPKNDNSSKIQPRNPQEKKQKNREKSEISYLRQNKGKSANQQIEQGKDNEPFVQDFNMFSNLNKQIAQKQQFFKLNQNIKEGQQIKTNKVQNNFQNGSLTQNQKQLKTPKTQKFNFLKMKQFRKQPQIQPQNQQINKDKVSNSKELFGFGKPKENYFQEIQQRRKDKKKQFSQIPTQSPQRKESKSSKLKKMENTKNKLYVSPVKTNKQSNYEQKTQELEVSQYDLIKKRRSVPYQIQKSKDINRLSMPRLKNEQYNFSKKDKDEYGQIQQQGENNENDFQGYAIDQQKNRKRKSKNPYQTNKTERININQF